MLKSRLTRILVLGAAAASLTGIAATGAQAVIPTTRSRPSPGACYLPKDVAYAGQQASITAPSLQVSSPSPSHSHGSRVDLHRRRRHGRSDQAVLGRRPEPGGRRVGDVSDGSHSTSPSARTSTFFWAAIQEQLEVYRNGSLLSVGTFTPSGYRVFTNSGLLRRTSTRAGTSHPADEVDLAAEGNRGDGPVARLLSSLLVGYARAGHSGVPWPRSRAAPSPSCSRTSRPRPGCSRSSGQDRYSQGVG